MAERLRVVRRGFTYPVGASLARVQAAGGLSQLSPEDRAGLQWRRVAPGDWCDDMPAGSAAVYLERGDIERVAVEED